MSTKLEKAQSSLTVGQSPKGHLMSCRVNNPAPCEEQSLNKFGRGFYSYQHNGAVYQQNGMYAYQPDNGLRVYQRRPFITSEYYNSGCSSIYCDNNQPTYPSGHSCNGPLSHGDAQTNQMLDVYFASEDPFQSNSVPVSAVGVKGTSANSSAGWISVETNDGHRAPLWMVETQAQGDMFPCKIGGKQYAPGH